MTSALILPPQPNGTGGASAFGWVLKLGWAGGKSVKAQRCGLEIKQTTTCWQRVRGVCHNDETVYLDCKKKHILLPTAKFELLWLLKRSSMECTRFNFNFTQQLIFSLFVLTYNIAATTRVQKQFQPTALCLRNKSCHGSSVDSNKKSRL